MKISPNKTTINTKHLQENEHFLYSNILHILNNFYYLTYFVTLESVLYISFNLHEFNLS